MSMKPNNSEILIEEDPSPTWESVTDLVNSWQRKLETTSAQMNSSLDSVMNRLDKIELTTAKISKKLSSSPNAAT